MKRNFEALRLNPESTAPLYEQLASKMGNAIQEGWWAPNEPLPSERMLSSWLKVSRVTTRRAFDQLIEEGLAYRRQGSGTYVRQAIECPLNELTSFTELFDSHGLQSSSNWISRRLEYPSVEEANQLRITTDTLVSKLKRQRIIDGIPIAFEINTVLGSVIYRPEEFDGSLYAYFREHHCAPVRAVQHLSAMNATEQIARLCRLSVGKAMMQVSRTSFDASDRALEYTLTYCRSDYYDFVAELKHHELLQEQVNERLMAPISPMSH